MIKRSKGGRGGDAEVNGENSSAEGGPGGDAANNDGGRGGDASVVGDNARAVGGRGGRGGVAPGGRGGNAKVARDEKELAGLLQGRTQEKDALADGGGAGGDGFVSAQGALAVFVAGGEGGEAGQPDGRGGRGGRPFIPQSLREQLRLPDRRHMRWPYFEPVTEPGHGGDGGDTPQYKARRMIVEQLKRRYCEIMRLNSKDIWWDRSIIPIDWINVQLRADGHRWEVSIIDQEYEFADLPEQS